MSDDNTSLILGLMALGIVLPALFFRQLPFGKVMKMVLAWVGIFAVLFLVFSFRDSFSNIWKQVKTEFAGSSVDSDGSLRIPRDENGRFTINVSMNGKDTRMLIDSGATVTSISTETARKLGIEIETGGFPVIVETANGMAQARRARLETLKVGPITRSDFAIHVGDGIGEEGLLGMDFLNTLGVWRVEGSTMILNPEP